MRRRPSPGEGLPLAASEPSSRGCVPVCSGGIIPGFLLLMCVLRLHLLSYTATLVGLGQVGVQYLLFSDLDVCAWFTPSQLRGQLIIVGLR